MTGKYVKIGQVSSEDKKFIKPILTLTLFSAMLLLPMVACGEVEPASTDTPGTKTQQGSASKATPDLSPKTTQTTMSNSDRSLAQNLYPPELTRELLSKRIPWPQGFATFMDLLLHDMQLLFSDKYGLFKYCG